jgi:metal-responsive CopG/Arc/MetJ family transcriptional regulator
MLDEYKLKGATKKLDIEIETEIAEKLMLMEQHSKLNRSEIVNTALKRFISHHKDFLPMDSSSKGKT